MTEHRARKRFGQHFLTDTALITRMVRNIIPKTQDTIVEIGPGQGALTDPLLEEINHLHVVELDRDLIARLQHRYGPEQLTIHAGDALQFDFSQLARQQAIRVVGNLPYNISTPLIFHLLNQAQHIRDMHFMLQNEVVERLTATPGSGQWGRLSVMVQYRCATEYVFFVPPEAFSPPPKVDSAVVRLTPYTQRPYQAEDEELFARMVKNAFMQRRKTIRNGLKPWLTPEQIEHAGVSPSARPDQLPVADFVALANLAHRLQVPDHSA